MARFFKTRGLATRLVQSGRLRVDGAPIEKAATTVRPGSVLTFPQGSRVRVVRVEAMAARRGPAPEAAALYSDLSPAADRDPAGPRAGTRPTARERREIARRFGPES